MGSSGCGKSSVVKTLATLAERPLRTLPVTSAMDTTDILGGFEQVSLMHVFYFFVMIRKLARFELGTYS